MTIPRRHVLLTAAAASLCGAAAAPRRLVIALAEDPQGVIPGLNDQPACRMVGTKIYQGLVRFDAAGQVLPALARSWTVSPDGLTYSFTLPPGVVWHDGVPLSADDVVFSLDRFHRLMSPRIGPMLARIASVRAAGPLTVAVTLTDAAQPLLPLLPLLDGACTPIVPFHIHNQPGFAVDPRAHPPIGTGPFQMTEWLRLTPFAASPNPPQGLDEIVFPVIPGVAGRLTAALDTPAALLVADAVPLGDVALLRQRGLVVTAAAVPNHASLVYLDLNPREAPLGDARVRRALTAAIDRSAVLRQVWAGFGQVAAGPLAGAAPTTPLLAFDPRAAAAQLDAIGLRPGDDGIRLWLRMLTPSLAPWPDLAAAVTLALSQVGIAVTTETVSVFDWHRRVEAGDYQMTGIAAEPDRTLIQPGQTQQAIEAADRIWLVEPYVPVVADRRLRLPNGAYSDFADASFG